MSPGKIVKAAGGVIVIIVLTTTLPFFDNLPWNMPAYQKRAVVREQLEKMSKYPPMTAQEYAERGGSDRNPEIERSILELRGVYPSPLRMIQNNIRRKPQWRAWGLLAMRQCTPNNALQGRYAPELKPLIQWLEETDSIVASNALAVLQTYAALPEDTYEAKRTYTPAEWRAIYGQWLRKDEPRWHQIEGRYFCDRNWPEGIQ